MKNFILFYLLFISINLLSQVQENMIMDRFNMNEFNPAYVGSEGREVSFTSSSARKGISQSPKTNYIYNSGNPKKNLSHIHVQLQANEGLHLLLLQYPQQL